MKKTLALAGLVFASALTLTGCGLGNGGNIDYSQQSANDGGEFDWDLGHKSKYNDKTYCKGGTYTPVSNGYTCTNNGIVSKPTPRPATPIKPAAPKVQNAAPKAPAPAQKAPAPAPKAPAPAPKSKK